MIVNKNDSLRPDGSPIYGPLKDLSRWFLESHFMGQKPSIENMKDREPCQSIIKVQRVCIGNQAELLFSFEGTDELGDLMVLGEYIIPNRNKFLKGNLEVKKIPHGLIEFHGGEPSSFIGIHDTFVKVKKIGEDFGGGSLTFLRRVSGELFWNLIMVEGQDDIAEIRKDDFDGGLNHLDPLSSIFCWRKGEK